MIHRVYYTLKPYLPARVRILIRRLNAARIRERCAGAWPVLEEAGHAPEGWPGWPGGKRFAFVLTHDVEDSKGLERCRALAELEMQLGFRSSFNFIPEGGYRVPDELVSWLIGNGFEVGVHDLHHDGKLFRSRKQFENDAQRINSHLKKWGCAGFRAGFMLHRLDWLHALEIEYDASTFDTDPFEPQTDGVETVFPFWVPRPDPECDAHRRHGDGEGSRSGLEVVGGARGDRGVMEEGAGYIELPYTLVQDLNLFVVLQESTTDIWDRKLEWIAAKGGMALLNTHPDCMAMGGGGPERHEYPMALYGDFLRRVREKYGDRMHHALPREVAAYAKTFKPRHRRRPREVAMVVYNTYDNDNRVRRYAESLQRRGDRVSVYSLASAKQEVGVGEVNGVRVVRLLRPNREDRGRWDYLRNYWRFWWRSLMALGPGSFPRGCDLVHVHNMPEALVFAAIRLKWRGTKLILDLHDLMPELYQDKFRLDSEHWIPRLLRLIERWACQFSDHVIISNHLWKEMIGRRSRSDGELTALINHVDLRVFGGHRRNRSDDRFVIVYPGSLNRHQGLDLAIDAMVEVRKNVPKAELHIYGAGPELGRLRAQVDTLGLGGVVFIRDGVPFSEVGGIMANADLGVVPKRADGFGNEAFSTKIFEFMSVGLPVVVAKTKVDTFYFSEDCVRFFEAGNARDLAVKIVEMALDPGLRERKVATARKLVDDSSWGRMEGVYLDMVDRLTRTRFPVLERRHQGMH